MKYFLLTLLITPFLYGQGAHRIGQVLVRGNGVAANVSPQASILVCVAGTNCGTTTPVYSDAALSQALPQPIVADSSGNYSYYIPVSCVDEKISSPGQSVLLLKNVCPFNGISGGGGSVPTGTGFYHITSGTADGAARPVNVSGADITGILAGTSFPALTGDLTTSVGSLATTLATVNSGPGACGDATHVCQVTTNSKGLVTGQTAVSITAGGSGTVTSVGLSLPGIFSVSGSPVTATGTLAATLTNEAVHTVFSGPASGSSAAPIFRTLTAADFPFTYTGNTTELLTGSGSYTTGHGLIIDSFGNIIDAGTAFGCNTNCIISNPITSQTVTNPVNTTFTLQGTPASTPTSAEYDTAIFNATCNFKGWNFGNPPGATGPLWTSCHTIIGYLTAQTRGIAQSLSLVSTKHAVGDDSPYFYNYSDMGFTDTSGEGVGLLSLEGGETNDFFHGLVFTTGTGTTLLPVTYDPSHPNDRADVTDGSWLLDVSSSQNFNGNITGASASVSGMGVSAMPVSNTLTQSTAYGALSCTLTQPVGPPSGSGTASATCTASSLAGSAAVFSTGMACLASNQPEHVLITAVGSVSGGSQSITFTYRNPGTPASIWQGGPCGRYQSLDWDFALNGFYLVYPILGATDSSHLVTAVSYGGELVGTLNPYQSPQNLVTLTQSGTTVTASFAGANQNNQWNGLASAVIAGCSSSPINGTVTAVSLTNNGQTISWTGAAGGTSCATATISLPISYYAYHAYVGAEVIAPWSASNIPLEPNNAVWTSGDTLVEPHYPTVSAHGLFATLTVNNQNTIPETTGELYNFNGVGINGSFRPYVGVNNNQNGASNCTLYAGCGGVYPAPVWWNLYGPNDGFLNLSNMPLAYHAVIAVGQCMPSNCNSTDYYPMIGYPQQNSIGMVLGSGNGNGTFQAPNMSTGKMTALEFATGKSSNTDAAGVLTLSGGTQTYTFVGTYTSAPICVATDTTAADGIQVSATSTVLTISGTGSNIVNYVCIGRN